MGNVFFSGNGNGYVSVMSGLPPSICTNLSEVRSGNTTSLKWQDPTDTVVDGQKLCTWSHTVIVRKLGSYPKHETDGTVIKVNTIRNAYQTTPFVDTIEEDEISEDKYYYRAFPISVNGVVNLDPLNKFGVEMYEFIIDPNDSNPHTCVTYTGKNENYTPAYMDFTTKQFNYGSWTNAFFMKLFKPCMLKSDGTVDYYLNPNNYAQKEDGSASDVANVDYDGNAMVEIGQIWISEKIFNGKHYIRIANGKITDDFDCYTHTKKDGSLAEKIYRSIYDGGLVDNKIRSISGLAVCNKQTGNNQITYAKANGTGWNIDEYSVRRLINYLLVLISRSLNTQAKFGDGVRNTYKSDADTGQVVAGTLNDKGMFYGFNDAGTAVKVFHIENWWGNIWKLTNGLFALYGKMVYKMCEGTWDGSTVEEYNTNGNGYIDSGVTISGNSGSCIKKMKLVPGIGLVPSEITGSNSTYYCDGGYFNLSASPLFARFGAASSNGLNCGAFACAVGSYLGPSLWNFGVALSYKTAS